MTTGTQVALPVGLALPAHLQSAAAEIAAANAAAGGGIKTGGFPTVSIKANKFHEKEGGELRTYMMLALPGQPALPMLCLEAVVVASNAALSKTFFPGDYVEGSTEEPVCRSLNGVVPDADVVQKQHDVCATCPQNQWGSKISKLSQKEIKACDDSKQLAILPAADLAYKALGLEIKKGSLKNWGLYIRALSERGYPVTGLVTNVTFDATANGILQFAFNRFLTEAESAKVAERQQGSDVKLIVAQSRVIAAPMLAPPAAVAPAPTPLPAPAPIPPSYVPPVPPPTTPAPVPQPGPAPVPLQAGFGAAQPAAAQAMAGHQEGEPVRPVDSQLPASAAALAEPPKRARRTRAEMEAARAAAAQPAAPPTTPFPASVSPGSLSVDLSHLPPAIRAVVEQVGADSPAGQALLAQFPAPAFITAAPPATPAEADKAQPSGVVSQAPAAAPVAGGFGATVTAALQAGQAAPPAAVSAAASNLAAKLRAKLGLAR